MTFQIFGTDHLCPAPASSRTDCALCGCDASEHYPRFIKAAMPCQVRVCLRPPDTLLPEGVYEDCGCPGFEPHDEEGTA